MNCALRDSMGGASSSVPRVVVRAKIVRLGAADVPVLDTAPRSHDPHRHAFGRYDVACGGRTRAHEDGP